MVTVYFQILVFKHNSDYVYGRVHKRYKDLTTKPIIKTAIDVDSAANPSRIAALYMAAATTAAKKVFGFPVLCNVYADHAGGTIEVWFVDRDKKKKKRDTSEPIAIKNGPQVNVVHAGGTLTQKMNLFL